MEQQMTAELHRQGKARLLAPVSNLTLNTLFVETDEPMAFGEKLEIEFLGLRLAGQVVYASATPPRGAVICFEAEADVRRSIARAITAIEQFKGDGRVTSVLGGDEQWSEHTEPLVDGDAKPMIPLPVAVEPPPKDEWRAEAFTRPDLSVSASPPPIDRANEPEVKTEHGEMKTDQLVRPVEVETAHGHLLDEHHDPGTDSVWREGTVTEGSNGQMADFVDPGPTGSMSEHEINRLNAVVAELDIGLDDLGPEPAAPRKAAPGPWGTQGRRAELPSATADILVAMQPSSEPSPTDYPELEGDGATVRFDTRAQYAVQLRSNISHGGLVVSAKPLPIGSQRTLKVHIAEANQTYTISARVTFSGGGSLGFMIDSFQVHKAALEALGR